MFNPSLPEPNFDIQTQQPLNQISQTHKSKNLVQISTNSREFSPRNFTNTLHARSILQPPKVEEEHSTIQIFEKKHRTGSGHNSNFFSTTLSNRSKKICPPLDSQKQTTYKTKKKKKINQFFCL